MKTLVIINKRGNSCFSSVSSQYGVLHANVFVGFNPKDAALHASKSMIQYAQNNRQGGTLMAPPEVLSLVPEHSRKFEKVARGEKRASYSGTARDV